MLGLPAYASSSDAVCSKENAHCVTVGQWEFSVGIGLGGRTNPIVGNDDIPIFLMPTISYYGKRFFWQTDTIGYTLFESEHTQFNIIGTIGYDQTYFNDWGIGNFSIEGGGGGLGSGGGNSPSGAASPVGDYSSEVTPTPTPVVTNGASVGDGVVNIIFASDGEILLSGDAIYLDDLEAVGIDLNNFAVASLNFSDLAAVGIDLEDSEADAIDYEYLVAAGIDLEDFAVDGIDSEVLAAANFNLGDLAVADIDREDIAAADIDLDDLHDRDMAGLAGFEYIIDSEYVSLGLQVLKDVTSVHDGLQVRLGLSTAFEREKSAYAFSLGVEWKDSDTLDYYYGIRASEVDDQRFVYTVESELSYYLKFDWRYRLSKHWELRSIFHHRQFGEAITNSPLVNEDSTTAIFIGGVYHF